eukprot:scaffold4011_cov197-Ochromonas_danica.AAC.36
MDWSIIIRYCIIFIPLNLFLLPSCNCSLLRTADNDDFSGWEGCHYLTVWGSCNSCLNADYNNTWCSNGGLCFSRTNVSNARLCQYECSSHMVYSADDCSSDSVSSLAVAFSFLLLVLCPLCVVSGCIYITAFRCRRSAKVGVDSDDPIPVLQLATMTQTGVTFTEIPVMANAEVLDSIICTDTVPDSIMPTAVPAVTSGSIYSNGNFGVRHSVRPSTTHLTSTTATPSRYYI